MAKRALPLLFVCILFPAYGYAAGFTCSPPEQKPGLQIDLQNDPVTIDHTHSRNDLKNLKSDSLSPYPTNYTVHVNGLMQGAIKISSRVSFAWQQETKNDLHCLWFQNVQLTVSFHPVIYVAREISKDGCLYKQILQHEYKHLNTDLDILNKYRDLLKINLGKFLSGATAQGPFRGDVVGNVRTNMNTQVDNVIHDLHKQLQNERLTRQRAIDSRTEYDRVGHSCPGESGSL